MCNRIWTLLKPPGMLVMMSARKMKKVQERPVGFKTGKEKGAAVTSLLLFTPLFPTCSREFFPRLLVFRRQDYHLPSHRLPDLQSPTKRRPNTKRFFSTKVVTRCCCLLDHIPLPPSPHTVTTLELSLTLLEASANWWTREKDAHIGIAEDGAYAAQQNGRPANEPTHRLTAWAYMDTAITACHDPPALKQALQAPTRVLYGSTMYRGTEVTIAVSKRRGP